MSFRGETICFQFQKYLQENRKNEKHKWITETAKII